MLEAKKPSYFSKEIYYNFIMQQYKTRNFKF